jgi:hypothetical protein
VCSIGHTSNFSPAYGGPYCTYPWYAANSAYSAITFGADYPGTKFDYKQGSQFRPPCSAAGLTDPTPHTATQY